MLNTKEELQGETINVDGQNNYPSTPWILSKDELELMKNVIHVVLTIV